MHDVSKRCMKKNDVSGYRVYTYPLRDHNLYRFFLSSDKDEDEESIFFFISRIEEAFPFTSKTMGAFSVERFRYQLNV